MPTAYWPIGTSANFGKYFPKAQKWPSCYMYDCQLTWTHVSTPWIAKPVKMVASERLPSVFTARSVLHCISNGKVSDGILVSTYSPWPLKVYVRPSWVVMWGSPVPRADKDNWGDVTHLKLWKYNFSRRTFTRINVTIKSCLSNYDLHCCANEIHVDAVLCIQKLIKCTYCT